MIPHLMETNMRSWRPGVACGTNPSDGPATRPTTRAAGRLSVVTLVLAGLVGFAAPHAVAGPVPAPATGNLEAAVASGDRITVTGWALDPQTPSSIPVDIYVDGAGYARLNASDSRPDVGAAYPGEGAAHGFSGSVGGLTQGTHTVCAFAIAGFNPAIGCRSVVVWTLPTGNLEAATTSAGQVTVTGWAIDPDTAGPIKVDVSVDGSSVGQVAANGSRPDVGRVFPLWGPNHGFTATLGSLPQGNHTVCVTGINVGPGYSVQLGCRTVLSWVLPAGNLEVVTASHDQVSVAGWALDPDTAAPISVDIYVDGVNLQRLTADQSRPDVAAAFPGWGAAHGYSATLGHLSQGAHTVCAWAINVLAGNSNPLLGCRSVLIWTLPIGNLDSATVSSNTLSLTGWSLDPDTSSPISVDVYDGTTRLGRITADQNRPDVASAFPAWGPAHGFAVTYQLSNGAHTICAFGINTGPGSVNPQLACRTLFVATNPVGNVDSVIRTTATTVQVQGWAFDPDTNAPISVAVTANGYPAATATANSNRPDVAAAYPLYGPAHGFAISVPITAAETQLCVTARNVGAGSDSSLGCTDVPRWGATAALPATAVTITSGYGALTVSWSPPADNGGSAILGYQVTALYTNQTYSVPATNRSVTFTNLASNTNYGIAIYAINAMGTSTPALASGRTQITPPPQTTTPIVSTSRYLRALTGGPGDATAAYAMGQADAAGNPSGHTYITLLDIGAQWGNTVGLSATNTYIPNSALVSAVEAYIDGYASAQQPSAPVAIAVGTNNDTTLSFASGQMWAQTVINPLVAYARQYSGISVAGANDIEPGFRASAAATRSWVAGYLASTTAYFINNGSADGCSWQSTGSGCNNGWTMADLQWIAGGAAPGRIINLPQIYNTTMAQQWKYISLTGVLAGLPPINFGGVLTELGACTQAQSCYSLDGPSAWNALWTQLQSDSRTAQPGLQWATDLMIS